MVQSGINKGPEGARGGSTIRGSIARVQPSDVLLSLNLPHFLYLHTIAGWFGRFFRYLTLDQLEREIKEEVYVNGGRISADPLPLLLGRPAYLWTHAQLRCTHIHVPRAHAYNTDLEPPSSLCLIVPLPPDPITAGGKHRACS